MRKKAFIFVLYLFLYVCIRVYVFYIWYCWFYKLVVASSQNLPQALFFPQKGRSWIFEHTIRLSRPPVLPQALSFPSKNTFLEKHAFAISEISIQLSSKVLCQPMLPQPITFSPWVHMRETECSARMMGIPISRVWFTKNRYVIINMDPITNLSK